MNISEPAIRRPVGTMLVAVGLFLVGLVAYKFLPVASMPAVDFPTITVTANRPGADPETMAATVAAPIERRLGQIPGVVELTSSSSLGSTKIAIQFELTRNIDGAARDVQAAINAAVADLPGDLQSTPSFRKSNPTASPLLILALTSKTIPPSAMYDAADTVVAQRLSQVRGVAEVGVNGAEQPAVRVRVNSTALASMGLSMEDVRTAIANSNAAGPVGVFDGDKHAVTIGINDQLRTIAQYDPIVVRTANGNLVRLSALASIELGVRNSRSAAWYNRQPSVLLVITKDANSNAIEIVDRIFQVLPDIKRYIPSDIDITVLNNRTGTIRASIHDMGLTLSATIALVTLVVFLFLRRAAATMAATVTVPLALAGTCAAMWAAGFSINNLSLMALVISVGFVVDDAIVMIENCFRNLEKGMTPMQAALEGARQVGFTVLSISVSLLAAFIPLLFMSGVVGRVFREFSVTLAFAIAISTAVSLTVTPMICARFVRAPPSPDATWIDRFVERILGLAIGFYGRSLRAVLHRRGLMLFVTAATLTLTGALYVGMPKGYFPNDDTGLIYATTYAPPEISFQAMYELQQKVDRTILADPAVSGVGSSVGSPANYGATYISLIPSAPLHQLLYQALGWAPPVFAHVPDVLGRDGRKLSKRHGAVALLEYRDLGYLPEAVLNYMALLGWSYDDKADVLTRDQLIGAFSLERVGTAGAKYDEERLLWFNGVYIRQLDAAELTRRALPFLERPALQGGLPDAVARPLDRAFAERVLRLEQERMKTLAEAPGLTEFFFADALEYDAALLVAKGMDAARTRTGLERATALLEGLPEWSAAAMEPPLRALVDELGLKPVQLFTSIRVAATGRTVSPPLFDTLEVLGRERSLRRLRGAIERLGG